ncbi:hypothetical protein OG782_21165 [Streptomyces sp. NBC_00876]|uniref:hypothetical protein n=1 Tax=Streptomyces sp. NBC_00876 TaxID=2975853 RepID=UPI0038671643|nr:hypothetical protein OG782_21165 [Streptomyces sp. NBC_00876]
MTSPQLRHRMEAVADPFEAGLHEQRLGVADLGGIEDLLDVPAQLLVGLAGRS